MTATTPSSDPYNLDFASHFSTEKVLPEPSHSPQELKEIDDLGSIGAATLKDQGFYARIVSARSRGAENLPLNAVVLVVEDDPGTSMVIVKALETYGYRPRKAHDRQSIARALAELPRPDLILLDVMLPDINGFDVLNRIRRHPAIQSVPVIMLTSLSETGDIARGLSLGADAYLSKPLLPSTLLDAVQAVLGG
jgi:CheY-like chemotaxis protein